MTLNEAIVEDAALLMPWASLIPTFSQREKESEQEKLVGRLREAIRRLNPAIPEEARATIREFRIVRFERITP